MSDLPIDTRSRSAGSTASIPHSIHFNQSVGYTSSLPSSSTSQSLMNFSNLCANKHYQKNFIIRKYYTRETEAMIQQQMNQDSSSTSSSSLSTTIPSSSISNSDINKSSISSNSTIVINPSGLSSSSSLVTGGGTTAALAASGATGSSSSELVWLTEMEKGYDILVDAIYPYICDIATLAERN